MIANSIKANKDCEKIRKEFNLCRGNVVGKFIDPV